MASVSYNFHMEDQKPIFTLASETATYPTSISDSMAQPETRNMNSQTEGMFSSLSNQFQGRSGNELLTLISQQEPRQADTAPTAAEIDLMNFRMNGTDFLLDNTDQSNNAHNFYMGSISNTADSISSHGNMWSDVASTQGGIADSKNGEMVESFDFLIKCLSSANNYVSMLTREQLAVLRLIRPGLLYEFLQEVARIRGDKRMRRAIPSSSPFRLECAFCKNNGESDESCMHALKDWRGRVLCPVLRVFRCPRCGATGDNAHTIKYCRDNPDNVCDRGMNGRRRGTQFASAGSLPPMRAAPPTPAQSPSAASAALSYANLWE